VPKVCRSRLKSRTLLVHGYYGTPIGSPVLEVELPSQRGHIAIRSGQNVLLAEKRTSSNLENQVRRSHCYYWTWVGSHKLSTICRGCRNCLIAGKMGMVIAGSIIVSLPSGRYRLLIYATFLSFQTTIITIMLSMFLLLSSSSSSFHVMRHRSLHVL